MKTCSISKTFQTNFLNFKQLCSSLDGQRRYDSIWCSNKCVIINRSVNFIYSNLIMNLFKPISSHFQNYPKYVGSKIHMQLFTKLEWMHEAIVMEFVLVSSWVWWPEPISKRSMKHEVLAGQSPNSKNVNGNPCRVQI